MHQMRGVKRGVDDSMPWHFSAIQSQLRLYKPSIKMMRPSGQDATPKAPDCPGLERVALF